MRANYKSEPIARTNAFGFEVPREVPKYSQIKQVLDKEDFFCFTDFFNHTQVRQIVEAFYAAEDDWTVGFEGAQYALGEVWYHYTEAGEDTSQYRERANASRKIFEHHIPGLHDYILSYIRKVLDTENVMLREGWAGPGIVNFPARNWCAENGGAVHYDTEGLPNVDLSRRDIEAYSFVAMLQKPESGGNLKIWEKPFDYNDPLDRENTPNPETFPNPTPKVIEYRLRDLWMFNGLRAHQIEPFGGKTDRIALTFTLTKRSQIFGKCGFKAWQQLKDFVPKRTVFENLQRSVRLCT